VSGREFVVLLVTLGCAAVLVLLFGERYFVLVFVAIAAVGMWGELRREWILRALDEWLTKGPASWRSTRLTYLEGSVLRPDLEQRVGETAPLVPLRGTEEYFPYPQATRGIMLGMTGLSAVFTALPFVLWWIEHPSASSDPEAWWVLAMFAAFTLYFGRSAYRLPMEIRVSNEEITLWSRGSQRKAVRWDDLQAVVYRRYGRQIVIKGSATTLRVPDSVDDFGRLLNIVTSRAGSAWRGA
jgi:hypothetical protein